VNGVRVRDLAKQLNRFESISPDYLSMSACSRITAFLKDTRPA
jgi:hypothetical protein